jgi:hypothetical protein
MDTHNTKQMSDREDSSDSNATGDNSAAGIQNIVCIAPLSARVHGFSLSWT